MLRLGISGLNNPQEVSVKEVNRPKNQRGQFSGSSDFGGEAKKHHLHN
jgi:hypothetical protein